MKYYLISIKNLNTNATELDDSIVYISNKPAVSNLTGDPVINGSCGISSGYSMDAHGEFELLEDALKVLLEIFGKCRPIDLSSDENKDLIFIDEGEYIFCAYRMGQFKRMTDKNLDIFSYSYMLNRIVKDTSDHQIDDFADEILYKANVNGFTFNINTLIDMMKEHRRKLCNED